MNINFKPSTVNGTVEAISSKTELQRIVIASALCDEKTVIHCNCVIKEVESTVSCLNALGADITYDDNKIVVRPIKSIIDSVTLDCGDSSLLARFLIPIVASYGINADFISSGAPISRPVLSNKTSMQDHGVSFSEPWKYPLKISGKLESGEYVLDSAMSSQYATGLMFALPVLQGDSVIRFSEKTEYKNYIDMTISILEKFGIIITKKDNCLYIKGNQKYFSPKEITAAGDWISSACLLCAGAVSGEVTVKGLEIDSFQTEKAILDALRQFGAEVTVDKGAVTVKKNQLNGIQISATELFEIVPMLAAVGACCESGLTVISEVKQYRLRGRNAMTALSDCLCAVGAASASTDDGIIIWSGENIVGGEIIPYNDSKFIMSMAILALKSDSEITVKDAECINNMNPKFLDLYKKIGGAADVIDN